jgi:hypothetical protein
MKISELHRSDKNPRIVTPVKRKMLEKALMTYGDLSGVIFNRKTKRLVGGNVRTDIFDEGEAKIVITKEYSNPTKVGTMAIGYIELNNERFAYREVYWNEHKERAANIAANQHAGDWDVPLLNDMLKGLKDFNAEFDMRLTMFDADDLAKLPQPIEVGGHTRAPKKAKKSAENIIKCEAGQVYRLATISLLVGESEEERRFCDEVIAKFERVFEDEAILQPPTKKRPAEKA